MNESEDNGSPSEEGQPSVNPQVIQDHRTEATVKIPLPIFWARGKEKVPETPEMQDSPPSTPDHYGVKVKYKERDGNYVRWLIDGAQSMFEMCEAFCEAKDFIYIVGSYFSPGINLVRDDDYDKIRQKYKGIVDKVRQKNREHKVNEDRIQLVSLLAVRADEGVKVRIVLFHPDWAQESQGGPYGGLEAWKLIREWSEKIDVRLAMWGMRYEGHELGAHHQKFAVVSTSRGLIGFCGGVDFAYARWAKPSHHITLAERYPVIVLPGIMGTELKQGEEIVWPSLQAKNLKRLALRDDGGDVEPGITIGGILRNFHGQGYSRLMDFLTENGYPEGDLLFSLPYDWRKHLKDSAEALSRKVDAVLQSKSSSKAILVAHSMGGLVARYYAASGHGNKIRRLIQLGTPNHGSLKSFMMMRFGEDGPIPWFVPFGPTAEDYRDVSRNMPGVYHLLPNKTYFSLYHGAIFEKEISCGDPPNVYLEGAAALPNSDLVNAVMDTFDKLGDTSHCDDTHVFIGSSRWLDTIVRVDFDRESSSHHSTQKDHGDKTVPTESVRHLTDILEKEGTNIHLQDGVEHGKLVQDSDTLSLLLSIIEEARIGGDSLDIPTRVDAPIRLQKQMAWIDPSKVMGEWIWKDKEMKEGEYVAKGSQVLWHDVHAKFVGPAVYDLVENFAERYEKADTSYDYPPGIQSKAPVRQEISRYKDQSSVGPSLLSSVGPRLEDYSNGKVWAQIQRSYYSPPSDDYAIWDSYRSLFGNAMSNIYVETQYAFGYHWLSTDEELLNILIENLQKNEQLKVIIVAPFMPDNYDGTTMSSLGKLIQASATPSNDYSKARVSVFSLLSEFGYRKIPIYVHAKIAVVDDEWAMVGSANLDTMGMGGKGGGWGSFGSSEIGILVHGREQSLALRNKLAEEHLGRAPDDDFDGLFRSFANAAEENKTSKDSSPLKKGQLVFHRVYDESKPKIPHPAG